MVTAFSSRAFQDRLSFAIGQALTRQRFENQAQLATRLTDLSGVDIKQSAVSRWTTGSRPGFEHLVALAELAAVDPGWLAVGSLSKAPEPDAYLPLRESEQEEAEVAVERITPVVKKTKPAPKGAPALSARKSGGGSR
jgi:hypothetical protein